MNVDVKEEEVENYSKVEFEERGPSIEEGADENRNQRTEGNHTEKDDMLDKSKKEPSSKKPVHSFFSKYS
jgi:hypothetical protein